MYTVFNARILVRPRPIICNVFCIHLFGSFGIFVCMKREVSAVVSGRGLQGGDQEPGSVRLQRSRPGEGGGGPGHLPGEQAGEWNTGGFPL